MISPRRGTLIRPREEPRRHYRRWTNAARRRGRLLASCTVACPPGPRNLFSPRRVSPAPRQLLFQPLPTRRFEHRQYERLPAAALPSSPSTYPQCMRLAPRAPPRSPPPSRLDSYVRHAHRTVRFLNEATGNPRGAGSFPFARSVIASITTPGELPCSIAFPVHAARDHFCRAQASRNRGGSSG